MFGLFRTKPIEPSLGVLGTFFTSLGLDHVYGGDSAISFLPEEMDNHVRRCLQYRETLPIFAEQHNPLIYTNGNISVEFVTVHLAQNGDFRITAQVSRGCQTFKRKPYGLAALTKMINR